MTGKLQQKNQKEEEKEKDQKVYRSMQQQQKHFWHASQGAYKRPPVKEESKDIQFIYSVSVLSMFTENIISVYETIMASTSLLHVKVSHKNKISREAVTQLALW